MVDELRFTSVGTAVGSLFVGYDGSGITVAMLGESEQAFVERALDELGRMPIYDPDPPAEILAAIEDRMQNNTPIKLNLEPYRYTPFQRAVLDAVVAIPRGEVRTYGEVALEVGMHEQWAEPASVPGQYWAGFRLIDIAPHDAELLQAWVDRDTAASA